MFTRGLVGPPAPSLPPSRMTGGAWTPTARCNAPALVNHIVSGHFWAAGLARGRTIADVDDRLDGDLLGSDPLATCDRSLAAAEAAFTEPHALERTCTLSYGTMSVAEFCGHRASQERIQRLVRTTSRSVRGHPQATLRSSGLERAIRANLPLQVRRNIYIGNSFYANFDCVMLVGGGIHIATICYSALA
jgi:hypothetical protein